MLFSSTIRLSSLISLCRTLHHQMDIGISPVKIFQQQAKRGARDLREIAQRIHKHLHAGNSMTSAFRREPALPPLMVALVSVGEESGQLAEIFGDLEKYYSLQWQLERQFRSQVIGPAVQFILAVFIVAAVIWILGFVAAAQGPRMTVFGLVGTQGALIFLGLTFGTIVFLYLVYKALRKGLRGKEFADRFFLRVPALGGCLRALALGRFTLALHLTLDSAMAIHKAVHLSLSATGNAVYEARADEVANDLQAGLTLTEALGHTRLFPRDFMEILALGEQTGRVPEVMRKQCQEYHEQASRRLKALTQVLAWGVWFIYAIYVTIMIFQLATIYFSTLKI